jgi:hypothetical protein
MANKRVIKALRLLFVAHIFIALIVVFFNPYMGATISRLYLRYVVPGPFFTEQSITSSHHLTISWSDANGWTSPMDPALESFNKYHSTHNVYYLNKCRLERSFSYGLVSRMMRKKNANILNSREWKSLQNYLKDKVVPGKVDSIRVEIYRHTPLRSDSVLFSTKWTNHL